MNTWTISRRVIAGFAILLLITAALGVFALWRLQGLRHNLVYLADNVLPTVLTLNESAALSGDSIFTVEEFLRAETEERRTELEQHLATNRARVDELFRHYENDNLITDNEDRRLFEEAKRTRAAFVSTRTRLLELVRQGKTEEYKKWLADMVIPAYQASVDALRADVEYNNRLGVAAGETSKATARASERMITVALGLALVVASLLSWQVSRSTSRVLRELATNLDQGAIQTAAAARQISASSQTLSSGASEQAASVEETSASLEEMSSMIRATADNAQKAKVLAGEAHAVAQIGSRTMVEMTEAMAAIDTSSAEVAKIVKNIDEIAFQTNILALNAAVEAARAGEAGAGFAVVADEVRSLAQRSAAAAKETADKIEAAIASSRNGSRSCARVGESLTQIAAKVSSTDSVVAEIATAAREQAQGIEQINIAITQMDKVTQSNSASAEESASAAEELDAQAASLKEMVERLRQLVGCTATAPTPSPLTGSRYAVSARPIPPAPRAQAHVSKSLAGGGRKAIPMPGDSSPQSAGDDEHFRNF